MLCATRQNWVTTPCVNRLAVIPDPREQNWRKWTGAKQVPEQEYFVTGKLQKVLVRGKHSRATTSYRLNSIQYQWKVAEQRHSVRQKHRNSKRVFVVWFLAYFRGGGSGGRGNWRGCGKCTRSNFLEFEFAWQAPQIPINFLDREVSE